MRLHIYVWEGNGISDAYHDNGTLVVLAESPEQARELTRLKAAETEALREKWGKTRGRDMAWPERTFDGRPEALARYPDRVIELDEPTWVAFNGGGYD
jgi:hypothetical protein